MYRFPVYSLVDEGSAPELQALLKSEGWPVRHLSTAGARDTGSFLLSVAESLRCPPPSSWSALADTMAASVLSYAAVPERKVAVMWWGAGDLAGISLRTFIGAFDVFVDVARQAYLDDMDVALFMFGSGPSFLPLGAVLDDAGCDA